ncbi:MAG: hypothetical protein IJ466_04400 [Clostridia bacterium]|nr:hypothetical protein [Clostridia bacterium]
MEKNYQDTARRIESVRKLYSQIGQPLPASIIVDLYRHLPKIPTPTPEKKAKIPKQA